MALRKTVEDIFVKADPGVCNTERDGFADDLIIGGCMAKSALFANELDELNQKRFFPAGVGVHYKNQSEVASLAFISTLICYVDLINLL